MEKFNTNLSLGYRKCFFIIKVFSIFFSFTFSNLLFATNYYVNDNSTVGDVFTTAVGDNANNGTDPSTPKATLTNVLSSYTLVSGDSVFVDAGFYISTDANILLNVNGISIVGAGMQITEFDNNFSSADANRLFTITANDVYLANFSVTGYNRGTGDAFAIQFEGATNVLVENVLTYENDAGGGDAAIVVTNSSEVTFSGGGSTCNSSLSIAGGGVNVLGAGNTVVFAGYTFKDNFKALQNGSGLLVDGASSVTINNSLFEGNVNSSNGGGIFATGECSINISGTCFLNNSASSGATSTIYGGAISVGRGAVLEIDNCNFEGNSAPRGGAIAINTSNGSSGSDGEVNLTNCSFNSNAASSRGTDIYARVGTSRPAIFNLLECTFTGSADDVRNDNSASITIGNSGTPSSNGTVVFLNTDPAVLSPSTTCPTLINPCLPTPLPVELISFYAFCLHNNINITWQTASEKNNDYFLLERSKNGYDFERVVIIQGAGNTQLEQEYQFSDYDFLPGTSYYRLTQVDFDGESETFDIISVQNDCVDDENLRAHYNKEAGTIRLFHQFEEQDILSLAVYSVSGKKVPVDQNHSNKNLGYSEIIPFTEFAKGIYIITLQTLSEVKTAKIIIQ